jgi:phospholipase C
MGYHLRGQLPTIYGLADQFALCDAWHCSVLGPTWPNRYYLHGATSNGAKSNGPVGGFKHIFGVLESMGISNGTYFHDLPFQAGYFNFDRVWAIEKFFTDAQAGTLPAFTVIDPKFQGADANDDHPDHDVQLGQALMASIYGALAASPQWERMLFVITYDEHGGFFDHVPPPECVDERAEFRRLGIRVPAVVAGPYVRAGSVNSTTFEHSSVIATLQKRHGIEPVNIRAENANDLSSCIDPALVAASAPRSAPRLAPVTISMSKLREKMLAGANRRLQPELQDLADRGELPRHLDRRADGADVTRRVLEAGQRLGALRLTS